MCCQFFIHFSCYDWENIYFVLLSSSNRKFELSSIVYGKIMKQLYALYIFLFISNELTEQQFMIRFNHASAFDTNNSIVTNVDE